MSFRDRLKSPDVMIRIGLVCLVIGLFARLFLHPADAFWQDCADGATGFLMGVSIGTLLLAKWKGRQRSV